jgi:diguanylate cyclase (GGDEF)-like protein
MDLRSIYEISTVILGCLSVYLYLIQVSTPNLRGMNWVSLGYACGASGTLLVSLRGDIPDLFSVLLANALLLLVNIGLYWGVADLLYVTKRRRWLMVTLSVVPTMLLQSYYTFVHNLQAPRIISESLVLATQCVLTIVLLLRHGSKRTLLPRCSLASALCAWIGFQMLRVYLASFQYSISKIPVGQNINPNFVLLPVLAAIIAGLCFIWLAMSQLQHELELLSETDPLTGLMNRRALERSAAREIAISRRRMTPLALILLDLDHFKNLNDVYGHTAGDAALISTARSIGSGLREVDLLARFGGEEFVALLPDTTHEEATHVAERLRAELEELTVHHQRKEIQFSASFGVTMLMPDDICLEQVLERGDIALYQAKHQGRNQVVMM